MINTQPRCRTCLVTCCVHDDVVNAYVHLKVGTYRLRVCLYHQYRHLSGVSGAPVHTSSVLDHTRCGPGLRCQASPGPGTVNWRPTGRSCAGCWRVLGPGCLAAPDLASRGTRSGLPGGRPGTPPERRFLAPRGKPKTGPILASKTGSREPVFWPSGTPFRTPFRSLSKTGFLASQEVPNSCEFPDSGNPGPDPERADLDF